jgi:hypothetical protein
MCLRLPPTPSLTILHLVAVHGDLLERDLARGESQPNGLPATANREVVQVHARADDL